jgi:hypothetical protein
LTDSVGVELSPAVTLLLEMIGNYRKSNGGIRAISLLLSMNASVLEIIKKSKEHYSSFFLLVEKVKMRMFTPKIRNVSITQREMISTIISPLNLKKRAMLQRRTSKINERMSRKIPKRTAMY